MIEYYQEQPEELPRTLPVGVRVLSALTTTTEAKLNAQVGVYHFEYVDAFGATGKGAAEAADINWSTVPRQPAPTFQPEPGDWCEGTLEGDDEARIGAFVAYADKGFVHSYVGAYAILRKPVGSGALNSLVDRASLRPFVHRCANCSEPVASEGAACVPCGKRTAASNARLCNECAKPAVGGGHFCDDHLLKFDVPKPDPYIEHRKSIGAREWNIGLPEQSSRLDQGIAAARRQVARDEMDRPMGRGKRVQWIDGTHPRGWPSADDNEP